MSNFNNFTFKINILGWWGAFPQPGGATCGVLVTTSEGKFLLDCGGGVLSKYFEHANLTDQFQGVLLSHLHYDHMGDVGCLYYAINYALRVGLRSNKSMRQRLRKPCGMQYNIHSAIPTYWKTA